MFRVVMQAQAIRIAQTADDEKTAAAPISAPISEDLPYPGKRRGRKSMSLAERKEVSERMKKWHREHPKHAAQMREDMQEMASGRNARVNERVSRAKTAADKIVEELFQRYWGEGEKR